MNKIRPSVIYWILTVVFLLITALAIVFYFRSGGEMSTLAVIAPCAAALIFSSLAVRARNEGK